MTTPPKRRIAFGITELDPGGAERMLTELVTRLDRNIWEPHVYCLGPEAHYARVLREQGIPVTCFGATGFRSSPRVIWQWYKELRRFRPQILYTWLFHANFLGRLVGRLARVPKVISGTRVAEKRFPWHGRLDRWSNFLVDRNVCVSRDVALFMETAVGLNPNKTIVIPNGVDIKRFTDIPAANLQEFSIPAGSRTLISIGRLEHQKGIDVLLSAIPEVVRRHPETHFLLVGDGIDLPKYQQMAQELQVAAWVHWAGRRDNVPALLNAAAALVLPSRWEGMPNVVLEAMAAGKPIIATEVEGVRDLVRPGVNGWLVRPEQPQCLADALIQFLSDPGAERALGQESQRIIQEEFTNELFVKKHVEMFEKLM